MKRQREETKRMAEVVKRSRERTDKILDVVNAAIKAKLEELREHGNLDDQFEPRGWHEKEE